MKRPSTKARGAAPETLETIFDKTLECLPKGRPRRVLLAVSGGADSMALLDLGAGWARRSGGFASVGHVDHGLRGRASRADAAFVSRQAAARGLPFRLAAVPTRAFSRRERLGTEEAARVLRYRALARMARAARCGAVLTAHTLDDQAETVVMNLVRGSGPDGLGGMPPASTWPVPSLFRPLLLRPLLAVGREVLVRFLRGNGTPFRTDATNALPLFFRNRVRPVLRAWERERPGLRERLARLAEILRDEESYWETLLSGSRASSRRKSVELDALKRYHKAFQRRFLRKAFGFSSFAVVERARLFALDPGPSPRLSVPGGHLEKGGNALFFQPFKP